MSEKIIDELAKCFRNLHQTQLKTCGLPEQYWDNLFYKIKDEIFDAGDFFQICMRVDEDENVIGYKAKCVNQNGLKMSDENGVFLIDHSWTYKVNDARQNLMENSNLLNRMCIMMSVIIPNQEDLQNEEVKLKKIDAVLEKMWKFNQTYKISTEKPIDDEREPIWYVMDEFGSSIRHSDFPTLKCSPFYYIPTDTMYSIIWPLKDLNNGDELTRDYAYGIRDEQMRLAKLYPWNDDDEFYLENLENDDYTIQSEPDTDYFKSGRQDEMLPNENNFETINISRINLNANSKLLNVYTDMNSLKENLTDPKFKFVDDMWSADIIFVSEHFKDYKQLREKLPNSLVNQFPFENNVTVKDLLAVICRRVPESNNWLPITYNLSYELAKFIRYFKKRESDKLDNHWILKPWNLARSIDTTVTNCLNQIIRSHETGPKVACKYITNPVLFYRHEIDAKVKFDVRYIVLLKSVKPLVIYAHKIFWLRFANKPYSLDNLEDYQKHFTVMNYKQNTNLKQINCDEFIKLFEEQNSDFKWNNIQVKIFNMIRQIFEGASQQLPPKGIAPNYQSRAMYAVDLMLDWRKNETGGKSIQPMLCEVNFMPDCNRACKYQPNFFNEIFNALFLDSIEETNMVKI